jgi:hypothetical protein
MQGKLAFRPKARPPPLKSRNFAARPFVQKFIEDPVVIEAMILVG